MVPLIYSLTKCIIRDPQALFSPGPKDERTPLNEGDFLVSATPPSGSYSGWGTGDGECVVAESLGKSYSWAVV